MLYNNIKFCSGGFCEYRSNFFWHVTPCSPEDLYRRFDGNILLPSSGQKRKPSKISGNKQVYKASHFRRQFS
jgi:hypothetical protein